MWCMTGFRVWLNSLLCCAEGGLRVICGPHPQEGTSLHRCTAEATSMECKWAYPEICCAVQRGAAWCLRDVPHEGNFLHRCTATGQCSGGVSAAPVQQCAA